jgi:hypothetical protein
MFYHFITLSFFDVVTFNVHYSDFNLGYKKDLFLLTTILWPTDTIYLYSLLCRAFAAKSVDIVMMTVS